MAASVARPQQPPAAPATSMMARVDRLDLVLGYLEDMMQQQHHRNTSSATSSPCTPASIRGGDDTSSAASTPRGSKTWRRRPVKEALEEAQAKGTLVDRISFLEDRVLKMEEDMDIITPEKITITSSSLATDNMSGGSPRGDVSSKRRKKGLKSLVKSCVRGNLKTKD